MYKILSTYKRPTQLTYSLIQDVHRKFDCDFFKGKLKLICNTDRKIQLSHSISFYRYFYVPRRKNNKICINNYVEQSPFVIQSKRCFCNVNVFCNFNPNTIEDEKLKFTNSNQFYASIIFNKSLQSYNVHRKNISTKGDTKIESKISLPPQPPQQPTTPPLPTPTIDSHYHNPITLTELADVEEKEVGDLLKIINNKPKAVEKKTILTKIKNEIKHYYHGFRLLFINIRVSTSLIFRLLRGHTLRRSEKRLLKRTVGDVFRLIPFSVFIVVPFMELTLPIFIRMFPGMLPTTFETTAEKEDKLRAGWKIRLEVAKFLQETLSSIAVAGKHDCIKCVKDAKEFAEFFQKVRTGQGLATKEEIMKFSHLFTDTITLDTLPRPQLVALCQLLHIQPFGTTGILRFQIETRLRSIHADDQVIMKEGVESLDLQELQQACHTRGMRALGLSKDELAEQLKQWIDLTLISKVPETLLLLSRAFMYKDGESSASTAQHIALAISILPDSAAEIAKGRISGISGKMDAKKEAELIKQQFKMITEERKEEREEKEKQKQKEGEQPPIIKVDDNEQEYPLIESEPVQIGGLLVCQPKKRMEIITFEDTKAIQSAVENLSRKLFARERDEFRRLKEKLEEYKKDLESLQSLPDSDLQETKAAKRLYKYTRKITKKMEKSIKKMDEREEIMKKSLTPKSPDHIRKRVLHIEELLQAIKLAKEDSPVSVRRLDIIADVLTKLADSSGDGTIRIETLNKVLSVLENESLNLSREQVEEVIEMIKKEEFIAVHSLVEKSLNNQPKDDIKSPNIKIESSQAKIDTTTSPRIIIDTTKSPHTIIDTTKSPHTIIDTTKSPHTIVDTTKSPHTIIDTTKSPNTIIDTTKSPNTIIDTTKSPHTIIDTTKSPHTIVDTTKSPNTIIDTTKSPNTIIDTTKSPDIKADTVKSLDIKMDTTSTPGVKNNATKSSDIKIDGTTTKSQDVKLDNTKSSENTGNKADVQSQKKK